MHSRAQAWYGRRTWHWRDWPAEVLLEGKRRTDTRISVVIPARNEERTIAGVVGSLCAALVELVFVDADLTRWDPYFVTGLLRRDEAQR